MPEHTEVNYWRNTHAQLDHVASGGEHEVFSLGVGNILHKINTFLLRQSLTGKLDKTELTRHITERQARHARLEHYFPPGCIEQESVKPIAMHLTEAECRQLAPDFIWPEGEQFIIAHTATLMQVFLPELEHPKYHKIFSLGDNKYAEERFDPTKHHPWKTYEAATQHLVLNQRGHYYQTPLEYWASDSWTAVCSPLNIEAVVQFAKGCITYSYDTDEALDLIGKFNVFFYDGRFHPSPNFRIIDGLWPSARPIVEETARVITRLNEEEAPNLTQPEQAVVLNGTNYVRIVNGLAKSAGLQERLRLFPDNLQWRDDICQRIYSTGRKYLDSADRE